MVNPESGEHAFFETYEQHESGEGGVTVEDLKREATAPENNQEDNPDQGDGQDDGQDNGQNNGDNYNDDGDDGG